MLFLFAFCLLFSCLGSSKNIYIIYGTMRLLIWAKKTFPCSFNLLLLTLLFISPLFIFSFSPPPDVFSLYPGRFSPCWGFHRNSPCWCWLSMSRWKEGEIGVSTTCSKTVCDGKVQRMLCSPFLHSMYCLSVYLAHCIAEHYMHSSLSLTEQRVCVELGRSAADQRNSQKFGQFWGSGMCTGFHHQYFECIFICLCHCLSSPLHLSSKIGFCD